MPNPIFYSDCRSTFSAETDIYKTQMHTTHVRLFALDLVKCTQHIHAWPAMRVISLGIRTVPVLSVAKKLAAPRPRPAPTAPAAKCELIRQDEAD